MEEIGLGILIGIGIAALKKAYRPALKHAIKLGMSASERVKDAVHEGEETLTDLLAEVRHERAAHHGGAAAPEGEPQGGPGTPASN
jgi:hypothetical protein